MTQWTGEMYVYENQRVLVYINIKLMRVFCKMRGDLICCVNHVLTKVTHNTITQILLTVLFHYSLLSLPLFLPMYEVTLILFYIMPPCHFPSYGQFAK